MKIERKEWSEGEFVEIHDPDIEDNPAAVLPSEDAEELAKLILRSDLEELVERWREEGIPIHQQNPKPSESAGKKAANQLEAVLEE